MIKLLLLNVKYACQTLRHIILIKIKKMNELIIIMKIAAMNYVALTRMQLRAYLELLLHNVIIIVRIE